MNERSSTKLLSPNGTRRAGARWAFSAVVLVVSLAVISMPAFALPGIETSIATCTTWSDTLSQFHRAKPVDDPLNGASSLTEAEFYIAKYGLESMAATERCEALSQFHRAKLVDDPLNGASSFAEAELYIAE